MGGTKQASKWMIGGPCSPDPIAALVGYGLDTKANGSIKDGTKKEEASGSGSW